jgi:hypothetical protein
VALPALVVVVLVAVVAIASSGSTSRGTGDTRRPPEALFDTILSLGLLAVALGGILFVYGLMQRKEIAAEMATGRYRRASLAYLVLLAAFVGVTYKRMIDWRRESQPVENVVNVRGQQPQDPPPEPEDLSGVYEATFAWIPVAVVVSLLLLAAVAYVVADRRGRRRGLRVELGEQLAIVLDDTLDDLRAETDPRRAIIAAYARLEGVLAASGTPRRAAETADEYLARVLTDLEIAPAAAARLTRLFSEAKFSQHEVDPAMKEDAIDALVTVRDELRRAREERATLAEDELAPAGGAA